MAVIDSGVQADHPDLLFHVLPGYQYLSSNDGQFTYYEPGGTPDPDGHGTHVAGIVAASTGNGVGVAGAAPGAEILPVTALCADGSGWDSDIANAIIWAVDNGARVVNMSIAGPDSLAVAFAVQYARDRDVVVVAAAGNSGPGVSTEYPAGYPTVIAVGRDRPQQLGRRLLVAWVAPRPRGAGGRRALDLEPERLRVRRRHVDGRAERRRGRRARARRASRARRSCRLPAAGAHGAGPRTSRRRQRLGVGLVGPDLAVGPTQGNGPVCT